MKRCMFGMIVVMSLVMFGCEGNLYADFASTGVTTFAGTVAEALGTFIANSILGIPA